MSNKNTTTNNDYMSVAAAAVHNIGAGGVGVRGFPYTYANMKRFKQLLHRTERATGYRS